MSATCHRCQGPAPLASDGYHRCPSCTLEPTADVLAGMSRSQLCARIRSDAERIASLERETRKRIRRGGVPYDAAMRGIWYEEPRPGVWRAWCPPGVGSAKPRVLCPGGCWSDVTAERQPFPSLEAAMAAALIAKEWWT